MKKIFKKQLLIKYVLGAFVKTLLISVLIIAVLFGLLKLLGVYTKIESMLDLKYNSPWILGPLVIAAALSLISFVVGLILYTYKYKRTIVKGEFYRALATELNEKKR